MTHAPLPPDTPPDIEAFYRAWSGLPKTNLLPTLSDYFDHAPPALQPFVAISDVYSPDKIVLRLLGTGLVQASGRDPTGQTLDVLYSENIRTLMGRMAHTAASHPVGYLCVRDVRMAGGRVAHCPSICLPINAGHTALPAIMTYARVADAAISWSSKERMEMVHGLRMTAWIDLGAGVPTALFTS